MGSENPHTINEYAFANLQRKLAEANARIVEFEDIKAGHLKVQAELKEKLAICEEALKFYVDSQCFVDNSGFRWGCDYYDNSKAKQALEKIKD